jgi:hypothetical protein
VTGEIIVLIYKLGLVFSSATGKRNRAAPSGSENTSKTENYYPFFRLQSKIIMIFFDSNRKLLCIFAIATEDHDKKAVTRQHSKEAV